MKISKYIYIITAAVLCLSSCDNFLDVMPDNRTELDSKEKIRALLTSAYPETDYLLLTEFSSDNVDNYGDNNPNTDRFIEQVYGWQDITESDNEDTENLWGASYAGIAAANQAIEAINEMGGAEATGLTAEMAEALLCRAYNHFILVNVFCMNYNPETAATDLGVTYMDRTEQGLSPKYERGTVADVYEKIEKDILTALPWVSDAYYTVPKYHFNQKAAYAFAAKFFLYYEKWDESIKYANKCLGSEPSSQLRDWKDQAAMTQDDEVLTKHYIDEKLKCNLLLMTAYSKMGLTFGPYRIYSKYSHGNYLAAYEDGIELAFLLGKGTPMEDPAKDISNRGSFNQGFYYSAMKVYKATNLDKTIFWKIPYLFEYTDPVAQIGYYRAVYPALSTDVVLLEKAEAEIITRDFDAAVADMNLWLSNISKKDWNLTASDIADIFMDMDYSTWKNSTPKKYLNPAFSYTENSVQECLLHFVLLLKRVETVGQGLRWFDIKRYGIKVERRTMNADGFPASLDDTLEASDPRRALQIPRKVVDAGYTPNPRF